MTDTRFTTYVDQMSAWYDKRTNMEILNLKLWQQLKVGVVKVVVGVVEWWWVWSTGGGCDRLVVGVIDWW